MQHINALSLAHDARNWLANSRYPRILHVFDHASNLINERREILSVVTPQIGNGPFNLVIEDDVLFSNQTSLESLVSIFPTQLHLGNLTIATADAKLWSPRPNWEALHALKDNIRSELTVLPIPKYQPSPPFSLLTTFCAALANANISAALPITRQLAGLGQGLTPAGDDFIVGAVLAAWIIHPPETARFLAGEITNIAASLTTSLSAAWLRSAGKGGAGVLWHNFFNALTTNDSSAIELRITELLSVGHTSGADAFAGFIGVFLSYAEFKAKPCHS